MANSIRTALTEKIVQQCGDNLWGSCAQFPVSDWQRQVSEGQTVLGYWEWLISEAEIHEVDLTDLKATAQSLASGLNETAQRHGWSDEETRHAGENIDVSYGPECIVPLENGRELRSPPFPGLCSYVRVTHLGYELAFWEFEEFSDDPACVLGALMGVAKGRQ